MQKHRLQPLHVVGGQNIRSVEDGSCEKFIIVRRRWNRFLLFRCCCPLRNPSRICVGVVLIFSFVSLFTATGLNSVFTHVPAVAMSAEGDDDVGLENLLEAQGDGVVRLGLLGSDAPAQIDERGGDAERLGELVDSRSDSCGDEISFSGHIRER